MSSGRADDQRDQARQHQDLDRIEAHDVQRIDLLTHLHGTDLGGDRRTGAAGDHDRGEQDGEFAQHQNTDEVHRKGRRAEALGSWNRLCCATIQPTRKLISATIGSASKGEILDVINDRRAAQPRGRKNAPAERRNDAAEELDPLEDIAAGIDDALAHVFENNARHKAACASAARESFGNAPRRAEFHIRA